MIDLEKLSFGALAAERDFDQGLKAYFIQSESFKRLRDGKKTVALGNRGSGKSAIFKMIADFERARGATVIELAPEDYSYELLARTMTPELKGAWAKQGAYSSAWKYLIYVIAMKALVRDQKGLKTGASARIYEYLRDNHKIDANPIGILISYLKRLEGVKIGRFEAGAKIKELQSLYKLEEIDGLLRDLNAISEKKAVRILVDELDRGWDASEDAIAFVAGLFQAATSINNKTPGIRVLVSLRRELYENIPALYEDAQKVRDSIEIIEWDEPQLLELIARRIRHSLSEANNLGDADLWNEVFSETLDYRQAKSFNYMIDRTLYRPREIIQFCIDVRNRMIDQKKKLPANYRIISEAEVSYSDARLKDIAAEYRYQYPGLVSVFETFRGLRQNWDRDALEAHCLAVAFGEVRVDKEAQWVKDKEPDDMIEILWRIGFLRGQAIGGIKARARSGSSYLGSHQISALNLKNINRFHIHPMFRPFLGVKESKQMED